MIEQPFMRVRRRPDQNLNSMLGHGGDAGVTSYVKGHP